MKRAVLILLLLISPAWAQAPQQLTPSQLALQLNSLITQMALQLEALQRENAELKAQLAPPKPAAPSAPPPQSPH